MNVIPESEEEFHGIDPCETGIGDVTKMRSPRAETSTNRSLLTLMARSGDVFPLIESSFVPDSL
jgi:hypothetical protein